MMSKKLMKETAESIDEIPAELGPALKMLGTVLQEEWMARDGVYLPEDERKQNPEPIAFVEDSLIQVRVGNKRITLRPSDSDKPALVIPVGMSDKKNTCSIPRDWLTGVWIDALIAAFDGDPSVALQFAARVNEAIDLAMITGEDGRQTVKQADLPSHRHAVEVAEITESLKRHFHGKSAGSPKVNMDFTIETIGSDHSTEMHKEMYHARQERENNVLNTLVPNPNVAQATPPLREVAVQEGSVVEASHPENTPLPVPATLEEDTVEHGASGESQAESESIPTEYAVLYWSEPEDAEAWKESGALGSPDGEYNTDTLADAMDYYQKADWAWAKELHHYYQTATHGFESSSNVLECDIPEYDAVDSTDGPVEIGITGEPLDVEMIILCAINNCGETEGATWGLIKKTAKADGSCDDLTPHRKVLDKLVKAGSVNKEGARRSTRYFLTGAGLEAMVGMPLSDVIHQDLEHTSMVPSGGSPIAFSKEPHSTDHLGQDISGVSKVNQPEDELDGLPDGEEPNTSGEPEYGMAEEGGMRMLTHQPSPEEIEAGIDQMFTSDLDREMLADEVVERFEEYIIAGEDAMISASKTVCANSGNPATFVVEDLPVGPRAFATEKDYCEYAGLEYNGEGYYGYTEEPVEPLPDEYLEQLEKENEEANEEIQRAIDAQGEDYTTLSYPDDEEPPLEGDADSEPATDAVSEAQEDIEHEDDPTHTVPSNDALGFGGY